MQQNLQPKITPQAMVEMVKRAAVARIIDDASVSDLQGVRIGDAIAALRLTVEKRVENMTLAELRGVFA